MADRGQSRAAVAAAGLVVALAVVAFLAMRDAGYDAVVVELFPALVPAIVVGLAVLFVAWIVLERR